MASTLRMPEADSSTFPFARLPAELQQKVFMHYRDSCKRAGYVSDFLMSCKSFYDDFAPDHYRHARFNLSRPEGLLDQFINNKYSPVCLRNITCLRASFPQGISDLTTESADGLKAKYNRFLNVLPLVMPSTLPDLSVIELYFPFHGKGPAKLQRQDLLQYYFYIGDDMSRGKFWFEYVDRHSS